LLRSTLRCAGVGIGVGAGEMVPVLGPPPQPTSRVAASIIKAGHRRLAASYVLDTASLSAGHKHLIYIRQKRPEEVLRRFRKLRPGEAVSDNQPSHGNSAHFGGNVVVGCLGRPKSLFRESRVECALFQILVQSPADIASHPRSSTWRCRSP
jgi:hypothetical protein